MADQEDETTRSSAPIIPVVVSYWSAGKRVRNYAIYCPAVPRVGDVLNPEAGSPVVVRVVEWKIETISPDFAAARPILHVTDPTTEEQETMTKPFSE